MSLFNIGIENCDIFAILFLVIDDREFRKSEVKRISAKGHFRHESYFSLHVPECVKTQIYWLIML